MAGAEKLIEKIGADAQRDSEKYWQEVQDKKKLSRDNLLRDISNGKCFT